MSAGPPAARSPAPSRPACGPPSSRSTSAVFGVPYDDEELLGKAVTRGPAWPPVGVALHVANGALFGAVYANVAPRAAAARLGARPGRRRSPSTSRPGR